MATHLERLCDLDDALAWVLALDPDEPGPEADRLRDKMDAEWARMTDHQRQAAREHTRLTTRRGEARYS